MATLEELITEASKLSLEERGRLRAALNIIDSTGNAMPAYITNELERAWIDSHRDEYLGQWVALDGNRLVAHGADAKAIYDEARAQGVKAPYLDQVSPRQEVFVGGWQ